MTMTIDPHRERELFELLDDPRPTYVAVLSDGVNVQVTLPLSAFDQLYAAAREDHRHGDCVPYDDLEIECEAARGRGYGDALATVGTLLEEAEEAGIATIAGLRIYAEGCHMAGLLARAAREAEFAANRRKGGE